MKLVIIGNGSTALGCAGRYYVNRHTAEFLADLGNSGHAVTFIEPKNHLRVNANLQDGLLPAAIVRPLPVSKNRPISLGRALIAILRAEFLYVFFPGTLPRAIVRLCQFLRKPYGIYLRGEQFAVTGHDAAVFRNARFICSVAGMSERVHQLNNRIITIRPMLDISPTDSRHRNFPARVDTPWHLLFVGRLEEAKGVRELIVAAQRLQAKGFPFILTLVGGGALHDELSRCFGNDVDAPIRVLGVLDNREALFAAYENADIFVLPTHHEGFPRVLYEAMIKSMVIMTTFVGGIPSLMISDHNCLEIPLRDPEAIVETIIAATADPENMQRLSKNANETVLAVLSQYPSHLEAVIGKMNA